MRYGTPDAGELLGAVRDFLRTEVAAGSEGRLRFHALVAANVVAIVERQLAVDPAVAAEVAAVPAGLGCADDEELAAAVAAGRFDDRLPELLAALAPGAVTRLRIVNPDYEETDG